MYYLGIDPGLHVGLCLLSEELKDLHHDVLDHKELTFHEMVTAVLKLFYESEMKYGEGQVKVIIESFKLFPAIAREVALHDENLLTTQIIGALKYMLPESAVVWQHPAMKNGCPDEYLRKLGLWIKTGGPDKRHAIDAMRHAVIYHERKDK